MDNDWPNIGEIVQFRIYYGDGKIVNGKTAVDWSAAPNDDVQVIFLKDSKGDKFRNNGQDLYALDSAMEKRILAREPELKRGKLLRDESFHPLYDRTKIDFRTF